MYYWHKEGHFFLGFVIILKYEIIAQQLLWDVGGRGEAGARPCQRRFGGTQAPGSGNSAAGLLSGVLTMPGPVSFPLLLSAPLWHIVVAVQLLACPTLCDPMHCLQAPRAGECNSKEPFHSITSTQHLNIYVAKFQFSEEVRKVQPHFPYWFVSAPSLGGVTTEPTWPHGSTSPIEARSETIYKSVYEKRISLQ